MRAIDTNVVLRALLNDDPVQTPIAMDQLTRSVFLSTSVLMETEWVMRKTYGRPRAVIATALTGLLALPTVMTSDGDGVRWALDRYHHHRADLADMLHIVAARGTQAFASFENRLDHLAGPDAPVPVRRLA